MSSFESGSELPVEKNSFESESSNVSSSIDCLSPGWQKSCSPVHLNSGKSVLVCNAIRCNYRTDKNSNFKRHFETMHCPLSHPKVCCNLRFVTKGEFRYHTKTVHCQGHRCTSCKKLFNRRALLDRHMSIHTGNKPFHCPECDYASANKANVRRHLSVHKVRGNGNTEKSTISACGTGSNCNLPLRPAVSIQHASPDVTASPASAVTCLEDSANSCHQAKETEEEDLFWSKNDAEESHVKDSPKPIITHSIELLLSRPYKSSSSGIPTHIMPLKYESGTQLIKNEASPCVSTSSYSINPNWSHTSALSSWTHFPDHFSTQQGFPQVSGHYSQVPLSYPTTLPLMTPPEISDERQKLSLYECPFLPGTGTSDKSHSDLGLGLKRYGDTGDSCKQNELFCVEAPHQESRIVPNHFLHFKVEAKEDTEHQIHLPNDSARECVIDCGLNYKGNKGASMNGYSLGSSEDSTLESVGKSEFLKKGKRVVELMNEPPPPPVLPQKVLCNEGVSLRKSLTKCQFNGGEYIHKKLRAVGKKECAMTDLS